MVVSCAQFYVSLIHFQSEQNSYKFHNCNIFLRDRKRAFCANEYFSMVIFIAGI